MSYLTATVAVQSMAEEQEVVTMEELELRLSGTGLPPGDITFSGLAEVAATLQRLSERVGRHLTGHSGPGRSPSAVERATRFRLRGTGAGSTVLKAVIGEDGVLGEGLEHDSLAALLGIFRGIADDQPPNWVTPLLGEATVDVMDALAIVSERCSVVSPAYRAAPIDFAPLTARRDAWIKSPTAAPVRQQDVSVSGRLDLVDLRRRRLRIRDAVGNDVQLDDVADLDHSARFVGQQVTATGDAVLGSRGQVTTLVGARIEQLVMPGWEARQVPELSGLQQGQHDVSGVDGIDEDEVAAFLELIGR